MECFDCGSLRIEKLILYRCPDCASEFYSTDDPDIHWMPGEELGCLPEGEYLLEIDLCSTKEKIVSKVVHAYYVKAGDVFADLGNENDLYCREDVIRWVPYLPIK